MNIGIIGGSGFVGERLCKILELEKFNFEILDINKNLQFKKKFRFLDISSKSSYLDQNYDVLINLAAVHRDDERKEDYEKVNIGGAINTCKLADQKKINKIIFTSSVAVYGFSNQILFEDSEKKPFNHYGRTKLEAEKIFKSWQQQDPYNRSLSIIRPTVVFGEGNRGNVYNLINQINSNFFMMIGNGKNVKSIAYVDNLAFYIKECIELKEGVFEKNYADEPNLSVNELVDISLNKLNKNKKFNIRIPYLIGLLGGYFFDLISLLTNYKLPISSVRIKKFTSNSIVGSKKNYFHFTPPYKLLDALEKTIDTEFLQNKIDEL